MPPGTDLDFAARAEKCQFHWEHVLRQFLRSARRLDREISDSTESATARSLASETSIVNIDKHSPRINHVSWGRLEVEGQVEPFKDAKLFPGGSCEWNWRETGTGHVPGIQVADVQELLDHGAQVVVLSRGMKKCLEVPPETLDFLKKKQIETHVLPTTEAVELYNKLAEKSPVGGLFHTTC